MWLRHKPLVSSLALRARPKRLHAQWRRQGSRQLSSTVIRPSGVFNSSDFGNQPFTGSYEPGAPVRGPLGGTSNTGAPKITPRQLKQYLDNYVVGQERAKKVLCTAIYNHYLRIQELQRQEEEYQAQMAQKARKEMGNRHPVEGTLDPKRHTAESDSSLHMHEHHLMSNLHADEYPGQQATPPKRQPHPDPVPTISMFPKLEEDSPVTLEKSNILLLGPSGVGKTLMAKTLATMLDVPFSISDCTPLTQAGYIGDDVELVIQRLLAAANYDVAKAEIGIVCLDEIDKIATAKVSHGKDVGGEGVQQALLKIIEGTNVTVQAKGEKVSSTTGRDRDKAGGPHQPPAGGIGLNQPAAGKNDSYTVRTDNILFICTGAFIGLHKLVMERIAQGSIGFNAPIRAFHPDSSSSHDTTIKIDSSNAELFKDHLPYWHVQPNLPSPFTHPSTPPQQDTGREQGTTILNSLDLVTPTDLQKFGFIPEIIGRIPVHCAVSPLTEAELCRVLTEPRNALVKQYQDIFNKSGIELYLTTGAMRAIARRAAALGTGARALRGVLEAVLSESMFSAPGSSTRYIIVAQDVVEQKYAPIHLGRGQRQMYENLKSQLEDQESTGNSPPNVVAESEVRQKASGVGR
jgi:ATP-dependent Clp protease ATP-binding subunit ClpX